MSSHTVTLKNALALIALGIICGNAKGQITEAWVRERITTSVLPPYRTAADTFQSQILQPLLGLISSTQDIPDLLDDLPETQTARNLLKSATQATHVMQDQLKQSLSASQQVESSVTDAVTAKVGEISATEAKLKNTEASLHDAEAGLALINQQLADTNSEVHRRWVKLICRRRFFIYFRRRCKRIKSRDFSILTMPDSPDYKAIVESVKPGILGRKDAAARELDQIRAILPALQAELPNLRSQLVVTSGLSAKLRDLILHIDKLFAGSQVLSDSLTVIIDFEPFIEPMVGVADEFARSNFGQVGLNTVSIDQLKRDWPNIKGKLAAMMARRTR